MAPEMSQGNMIKSVRFENFRCLRDVEVSLEPLTVFVGAPASGKSTVRFVQQGCALEHVAWSPDGNGLYATGVCPGERPYQLLYTELYRQPHLLADSSSNWFGLPTVSPDGKHLAFEVRPYDNDVWLATGF